MEEWQYFCFFFSSRRLHTRWNCDWSSDVCSSDLVLSVLTNLKRVEVCARKLGLIVKHFFEMRNVPVAIYRVPVESAAEMIVHSTRSHFAQRDQIHFECVLPGFALGIARVKSR